MAIVYRNLGNADELYCFLRNVLHIYKDDEIREAYKQITRAENSLRSIDGKPTTTHADFRDFDYKPDSARKQHNRKMLTELIEFERPQNDDDIKIGYGGAKPRSVVKSDGKCFIVIGLPASGKSGISNAIADQVGAYILDSDMAKRKFYEYYSHDSGASLVHEEADDLIWKYTLETGEQQNLLNYCVTYNYNIVIPKIGTEYQTILQLADDFKSNYGYDIYLVLVELDRFYAVQRAYKRYMSTGRYVPLSMIFDHYSNNPSLTYYNLKEYFPNEFTGFMHLDNNVPKGSLPIIKHSSNIDFIVFDTVDSTNVMGG